MGICCLLLHFAAPSQEVFWVSLWSALSFCILPFAFILWMLQKGHTETIEIRDREDRPKALKAALLFSIVGGLLMIWSGKSVKPLVISLVSTQIITTILSQCITHWWKISLHLTGVSGFLAGLYYTATHDWQLVTTNWVHQDWVFPALLLIPLLMWARMKVKAHTLGQVSAGAFLGFGTTYLLFWLINSYIYQLHP
jgi:membrane-associated phospholipid phosphatase